MGHVVCRGRRLTLAFSLARSLIRRKLEQLPAPCRVATYLYRFPGGLRPDATHFLRARDSSADAAFPVFLYSFPSAAAKRDNDLAMAVGDGAAEAPRE